MLDTFKARLKAKSTAAGANLSQKRIDAIADRLHKKFPDPKDDAEHDTAIDSLYDATDLKEFAQVDDYQRTKEAKEKKDKEDADKKAADEARKKAEEEAGKGGDEPAWFKAYREAQEKKAQELETKVSSFEKEKTVNTIQQKLKDSLKGVSELVTWEEWRQPETLEEADAFIAKVNERNQSIIDKGIITQPAGSGSKAANGKATDTEIKGIADKILPKN